MGSVNLWHAASDVCPSRLLPPSLPLLRRYVIAGDIVAYYISLPTGFDDEGSDSQTRIEYFDRAGLHDFLYNRWKESNGVLQRFVEPKVGHGPVCRACDSQLRG